MACCAYKKNCMKFLTALLLTALLSFVAGLYAPWWSLAIMSFLVAVLVAQRPGKAFLAGFFALFLLWGCIALWLDIRNKGLLSARIGELLGLGSNSMLLILVTALIGGLVAGFAALSGSYLRSSKKA
jgi:hypothetical protein